MERNWVGTYLVRKLAVGLLREGVLEGVRSWDVQLQKALQIVLQSALASRVGDITEPGLLYEDVRIKLHHGISLDHLMARVELRGVQGYKYVCSNSDHCENTLLEFMLTDGGGFIGRIRKRTELSY